MKVGRRAFLEKLLVITGSSALVGCSDKDSPQPQQDNTTSTPTSPQTVDTQSASPTTESNPLLKGLDLNNFVLHNPKPLALESIRAGIGMGAITATSRLFVRNNLPSPDESIVNNAGNWRIEIEGVKKVSSFTLDDLKQFAYANLCSVLQCSGNGRKFFKHGPSGSQWATGAAGCVMWGGVWLKDLIEACGGALDGMNYFTATGGEELPEDVPRDKAVVERSIPLEKGLKDCLIAWELNGEPIPLSHGGPVRFVVPGYFGCNQIKYVNRIAATKEQSTAKIMSSGYRFRDIGEKGNSKHPSMWRMPVKSWVIDAQETTPNVFRVHGVAFSGERGVQKVEYSLDGTNWKQAAFYGPDLGVHAWRMFQVTLTMTDNQKVIYTRATDTAGDTQPKERIENERGYGNNSWLDHGYNVQNQNTKDDVALAAVELDEDTKLAGQKVFEESTPPCGTCHTLTDAGSKGQIGPNLDQLQPDAARVERAVTNGVGAMPAFGETLSEQQIKDLARYVEFVTRK